MKFVNVEEFDVNSPAKAPLKDFFILTGGFIAVFYVIFWISGFFIDTIISSLPPSVSVKMENQMLNLVNSKRISSEKRSSGPEEKKLRKTVNFLSSGVKELGNRKYAVLIVHSNDVNAFAVPGGKIFVTDSLLKEVSTEKEINFVLAHELGHFAHKDHLKILGRHFVLLAISIALSGESSSTTRFLINSARNVELKYSQEQELNADSFAVNLICKKYGDTSGAIDFMRKISKKNKLDKFVYFFATHPHPEDRISAIENQIKNLN